MSKCRECLKEYDYTPELRKKGYRKTICNSCVVTTARRRRKLKAVKYKGGKCQICGYDKCILLCSNCHSEVHEGITDVPEAEVV
jgi:predicted HNH restriction endonuclease